MTPLAIGFGQTFQDALDAAEERGLVLPQDYYSALQDRTRTLAFTVTNLSGMDQIRSVFDSLNAAIAEGIDLRTWQQQAAAEDWGLTAARLETIYRTNVQVAYMAGHWRGFQNEQETQPYLLYSAVNDSRTRPAHRAMNGYIAPVHDQFWLTHTPPCGYNCRCTLISLTQDQAESMGSGSQVPPQALADPGFGGNPVYAQDTVNDVLADRARDVPPGIAAQVGSNLGHFG